MHYKFIHIFWANELKFSIPCLEMINESFDSSEHAFVTNKLELYNAISNYNNVFYINKKNLFNAIGNKCDWIISHDFPSFGISITTKKRYKKKIVFRYWGGRRTFSNPSSFFKKIIVSFSKFLYRLFFKLKYSHIPVVGIASVVDKIDLQGLFKTDKMFLLPYARKTNRLICSVNSSSDKNNLNVVIGHRSDPAEHHIKYLETLEALPKNKLKIYVPLSYGDLKYSEEIKKIIAERNYSNVFVIDHMMSYDDYCSFLAKMDIAIIDCLNSLALGNIQLLVSMGKTIYLNSDGVIAKAFVSENAPFYSLDKLTNISFDEFSKLIITNNTSNGLSKKTYEEQVECWNRLFLFLERKNET